MPVGGNVGLKAHAKINLCLSVSPPLPADARDEAGRARGGYHEISSWFVPLALHDDLRLTRLAPGEPSRYRIEWGEDAPKKSEIDWPVEKDLTVRGQGLLVSHVGMDLPVEMVLRKRIPVGGGLGGGSSDAAMMLVGLVRLFGLPVKMPELAELSKSLGADVAFFLDECLLQEKPNSDAHTAKDDAQNACAPRGAIVCGFGDRIERVERVRGDVLLMIPAYGCPTGAVYREYDRDPRALDDHEVRSIVADSLKNGCVDGNLLFNDLAEPASRVAPELMDTMQKLREAGIGGVHVTGSGSTLFRVSGEMDAADGLTMERLSERVRKACPEVIVVPTRMV